MHLVAAISLIFPSAVLAEIGHWLERLHPRSSDCSGGTDFFTVEVFTLKGLITCYVFFIYLE